MLAEQEFHVSYLVPMLLNKWVALCVIEIAVVEEASLLGSGADEVD